MEKKLKIHTLQHVPFEGLGCIDQWITTKGHSANYTKLYDNPKFPTLDEFDWLIVMGGPMGVYDEAVYPWLKGVVMCVHFNGLIPKKTFAQFHISPNVTEREFLTEDELKTLMTHELGMSNCSIFVTFLFSPASLPSLSWTSRN